MTSFKAHAPCRLVRSFIHSCLYDSGAGYFGSASSQVVSTMAAPINFPALRGESAYRSLLTDLYKEQDASSVGGGGGGEWFTPSELFRPHYSEALARYMVREHIATRGDAEPSPPSAARPLSPTSSSPPPTTSSSPIAASASGSASSLDAASAPPPTSTPASSEASPPTSSADLAPPLRIMEIGGGNGSNAAAILDWIRARHPDLYANVDYTLVEISPSLAKRQRARLSVAQHGNVARVLCQDALSLEDDNAACGRGDGRGSGDGAGGDAAEKTGGGSHAVADHGVRYADADHERHHITEAARRDPWFVLGLEVLDNLPHDKAVWDPVNEEWQETWVYQDEGGGGSSEGEGGGEDGRGGVGGVGEGNSESNGNSGNFNDSAAATLAAAAAGGAPREVLRPAEDDLITRAIPYFADKYIHTHPSGSSGDSGDSGDSGSSARSGANVDTVPVCGPVEVFVPTGALQLLEMLHRYLPKHKLLLADFDMLPPPDLGVWHDLRTLANRALGRAPPPPHNAPLVASRDAGQGVTVDRPSYLDAAASPADIFFPTDFPALADAYRATTNGREMRVMTSREFLKAHADVPGTTTRTGYNPLLEDFTNTRFALS